ncbi:DUF2147 domain-containing protein [Thalassovita taeanensis]|uniref:DUF2147 domain-containing protein n=1 Tax=Thalassovita taeanensis TaxID=657014 RepID=A0A1H9J478_9RHOB|nr:DUF2147 domain-containing protein [Thalassovita taeanensis]SEQ81831.1 hypothetical protein SAMN04488092_11412 [Thalassovita taeanensis]
MNKLTLAIAFAVVGAGAALADPVEGVWKTQVDDGAYAHVAIAPCGAKICGTITRTFNSGGEYKSGNIGKKLVWDMQANGKGHYASGKIWQPSSDKVYRSKMALSGDTLKVSGCIGPICKKQSWNRVK